MFFSCFVFLSWLNKVSKTKMDEKKQQLLTKTVPGTGGLEVAGVLDLLFKGQKEQSWLLWQKLLKTPQGPQIAFEIMYSSQQFIQAFKQQFEEDIKTAQNNLVSVHGCGRDECQTSIETNLAGVISDLDAIESSIRNMVDEQTKQLTQTIRASLPQ